MNKIKNKYYALAVEGKEANIYIYGDIVSWPWFESDVSSYTLVKEIEELPPDVEVINVHINSYGGEVAEGLAIYNVLKNHKAKVRTIVDGFAASIASVIFMAGDERIMSNASLLFIHNSWMAAVGNAKELRKQADDLETIDKVTRHAYLEHVNLSEEELKELLDNETWITPTQALEWGFATSITNQPATSKVAASVRKRMIEMLLQQQAVQMDKPGKQEPDRQPDPGQPATRKLKLFSAWKKGV